MDITLVIGMTPRTCPGNPDVGKRLLNKYKALILKSTITAFLSSIFLSSALHIYSFSKRR